MSVPLNKGKHEQQPVSEVTIAYAQPWYAEMWHTIKSAYGNAPYFMYYSDALKDILYAKPALLFELNWKLLEFLLHSFDLPLPDMTASYEETPLQADLRNSIHPKRPLPDPHFTALSYLQVFTDRHPFIANLSALDLLFCLGPEAHGHLRNCVSPLQPKTGFERK